MMRRWGIPVVTFLAWCGAAGASQLGVQTQTRWKVMDSCAKQAQSAFPDFTADSNAKREAKLQECLEGAQMPPRAPVSPASPVH